MLDLTLNQNIKQIDSKDCTPPSPISENPIIQSASNKNTPETPPIDTKSLAEYTISNPLPTPKKNLNHYLNQLSIAKKQGAIEEIQKELIASYSVAEEKDKWTIMVAQLISLSNCTKKKKRQLAQLLEQNFDHKIIPWSLVEQVNTIAKQFTLQSEYFSEDRFSDDSIDSLDIFSEADISINGIDKSTASFTKKMEILKQTFVYLNGLPLQLPMSIILSFIRDTFQTRTSKEVLRSFRDCTFIDILKNPTQLYTILFCVYANIFDTRNCDKTILTVKYPHEWLKHIAFNSHNDNNALALFCKNKVLIGTLNKEDACIIFTNIAKRSPHIFDPFKKSSKKLESDTTASITTLDVLNERQKQSVIDTASDAIKEQPSTSKIKKIVTHKKKNAHIHRLSDIITSLRTDICISKLKKDPIKEDLKTYIQSDTNTYKLFLSNVANNPKMSCSISTITKPTDIENLKYLLINIAGIFWDCNIDILLDFLLNELETASFPVFASDKCVDLSVFGFTFYNLLIKMHPFALRTIPSSILQALIKMNEKHHTYLNDALSIALEHLPECSPFGKLAYSTIHSRFKRNLTIQENMNAIRKSDIKSLPINYHLPISLPLKPKSDCPYEFRNLYIELLRDHFINNSMQDNPPQYEIDKMMQKWMEEYNITLPNNIYKVMYRFTSDDLRGNKLIQVNAPIEYLLTTASKHPPHLKIMDR